MKVQFFGPSYNLDSAPAECQSTINLIPELIESQGGTAVGRMRGTPGLSLFLKLPEGPVRGLWFGEGRLFAAAGVSLYEITYTGGTASAINRSIAGFPGASGGTTPQGTSIGNDGKPVLIFPNGQQLMVISAGNVYADNGNGPVVIEPAQELPYSDLTIQTDFGGFSVASALQPFDATDAGSELFITGGPTGWFTAGPNADHSFTILGVDDNGVAHLNAAPGASPGLIGGTGYQSAGGAIGGTGAFMDTYGIAAPAGGKKLYISALNDFTNWSALDEAVKEGYPDNILALLADHEELYVFGDLESTEVWQDTGNANFPFQRMSGGMIHFGLAAQYSPVRLGTSGVAWLAWSANRGAVEAILAQAFVPQRISTHAVEQAWRGYARVDDAIAYPYIEDGHDFWVIHFPTGDATWVYDLTASQQMNVPMWTQRAWWDGTTDSTGHPAAGSLHRQLQSCHTYGFLKNTTGPAHYAGDRNATGTTAGNVYIQSLANFTDNGAAIVRQRACPHLSAEDVHSFYSRFQLDADVGAQNVTWTFDYSRDFGQTFINQVALTAPATDGYTQRLVWRRLGWARDLVPRITTTSAAAVSIRNAYMTAKNGSG